VLGRAGVGGSDGAIQVAASRAEDAIRRYRREVPLAQNPAKRIAAAIDGRLPVVWGSEGTQTVAAVRWKSQLSENAKLPASAAMLPELCHNDIVGLHHGHPTLRDAILLVLRIEGGHPGADARLKAAVSLVEEQFGAVEIVSVGGSTPLERLIDSIVLGDFVSVYAAILRGVDPTPIEAIARLKAALA
ncbi:MAG: SIS domain-containing protein, partial [Actinomycetota bacterium]